MEAATWVGLPTPSSALPAMTDPMAVGFANNSPIQSAACSVVSVLGQKPSLVEVQIAQPDELKVCPTRTNILGPESSANAA